MVGGQIEIGGGRERWEDDGDSSEGRRGKGSAGEESSCERVTSDALELSGGYGEGSGEDEISSEVGTKGGRLRGR